MASNWIPIPCTCKWFDDDTLHIDPTCQAIDHGGVTRKCREVKWVLNMLYGPFPGRRRVYKFESRT